MGSPWLLCCFTENTESGIRILKSPSQSAQKLSFWLLWESGAHSHRIFNHSTHPNVDLLSSSLTNGQCEAKVCSQEREVRVDSPLLLTHCSHPLGCCSAGAEMEAFSRFSWPPTMFQFYGMVCLTTHFDTWYFHLEISNETSILVVRCGKSEKV